MKLQFNYLNKFIIFLSIVCIFISFQAPLKAQNVSGQLAQLSIPELQALRNERFRQAMILWRSCMNDPSINKSTCKIMGLQQNQQLINLDNYIAQRRIIGR